MNSDINIRAAALEDIPRIIQLYTQTVLTVCVNDYDSRQLAIWASLGSNEVRWQKRIAEQYFLVAEVGEEMVGFASLSAENYLDVFYVSKDFQRMGVANLLFDAMLVRAIRNSGLTITADVSKTAKPFFEKKGFVASREQENWIDGVLIINYHMKKRVD